ncbi:hypothetical protein BDW02DRAFT_536211 [Decorospora gaudefroyi]|uniref:Uncharacterized protein n=1 Tax=Decorospora gaudefroyi TaxID=184978 RepID=A0A6A5K7Z4_9PLEO|nr:hypothetical protein BDW02DRAFT_536211 [Decorospora gaudefroyi]
MHIMSASTGLPGNPPWPESRRFDSTIDFDIVLPGAAAQTWNCQTHFPNGTLPVGVAACTAPAGAVGSVAFGMEVYTGLGIRRPELSFVLGVERGVAEEQLSGEVIITANDPSESSSYLTCLGGAPFDGLRCQIGSYLSVRSELVIVGQ